jgi:predicted RNA-binding protein YlqC (UPF0109 family)
MDMSDQIDDTLADTDEGDASDDVEGVEVEEVDEDELGDENELDEGVSGNAGDPPIEFLADFVRYMVVNLVEDPEVVQVLPERLGTNVHIKVLVPEEEMGRVIGRQGRIARSMRTLLTIAASRKGLRASLDIDS